MIKSVMVTNYLGDSIKLELRKPEDTGLAITNITGIGPGSSTINVSDVATMDGGYFNSSRVSSRNIVISLMFLWKDTIEDARQLTYKYFPLKRKVTLVIETDNRIGEIEGYVESNEPNIFSEQEGTDISVICPYPFFYDAYETQTMTFGGIEPAFEFEFSNESLTEKLLEFSIIRKQIDRSVNYIGDCEVGVTITIRAHGEATNITFYNVNTREQMTLNTDVIESITGSGIVDRDEIVISTVDGNKSATLIREAKSYNILNAIDRESAWFRLTKGVNRFAYIAESGQNNIEVEIANKVLYEGV